ncbi:hypothetical protein C8J56DRAFT_1164095 [Mycena floridula]|nr:hypothetical protein C8J56DRAFT_1164095 [Mycena floridula]
MSTKTQSPGGSATTTATEQLRETANVRRKKAEEKRAEEIKKSETPEALSSPSQDASSKTAENQNGTVGGLIENLKTNIVRGSIFSNNWMWNLKRVVITIKDTDIPDGIEGSIGSGNSNGPPLFTILALLISIVLLLAVVYLMKQIIGG